MPSFLEDYYELLLRKGMHRYFFASFARNTRPFWLVLGILVTTLLFFQGLLNRLSLTELILVGLLVIISSKLGFSGGHKEGFVDGYRTGIDEGKEAYRGSMRKKATLIDALLEVQTENLKSKE